MMEVQNQRLKSSFINIFSFTQPVHNETKQRSSRTVVPPKKHWTQDYKTKLYIIKLYKIDKTKELNKS